jgi:hypothetical protein
VSLGGWLADRLGARDSRWFLRLPAVVAVAALPFAVLFLLLPAPVAALSSFAPYYAVSNMYVGPLWSTAQNLARPELRATASALLLFILNLIGLGLGPFVVGAANDLLAPVYGAGAIRWSLLGVVLTGGVASVLYWIGSRHLPADLARR